MDDTIRKKLKSHYKNYENFQFILSAKLLSPSNQIKKIGKQHPRDRDELCMNNAVFLSAIKIYKEQLCSQILELGITIVSRFENKRFEHYLTKPKSMLEWKLLALFGKNPKLVHSFDYKRHSNPFFQEFFDIYLFYFY